MAKGFEPSTTTLATISTYAAVRKSKLRWLRAPATKSKKSPHGEIRRAFDVQTTQNINHNNPKAGDVCRKPRNASGRGSGRGRAPAGKRQGQGALTDKRGQRRQTERAEWMIMSPSAFLRPTLQPDPMRELRFAEEIALRKEYRDIGKERLSDWMVVHIDIPRVLGHAKIPGLILQPLATRSNTAAAAPAARSKC